LLPTLPHNIKLLDCDYNLITIRFMK